MPVVATRIFPFTVFAYTSDWRPLASTPPFTVLATNLTPFGMRTVNSTFTSLFRLLIRPPSPGLHSFGRPPSPGYTEQIVTPSGPGTAITCTEFRSLCHADLRAVTWA